MDLYYKVTILYKNRTVKFVCINTILKEGMSKSHAVALNLMLWIISNKLCKNKTSENFKVTIH